MIKLAIVTTHPIQYYAPIFQLLHQRGNIEIKVFYTLGNPQTKLNDAGFGKPITWDLPLLDGYNYEWLKNTAKQPGSHHFKGIKNPGITDKITEWQPSAILIFGWAYHAHLKVIRHFYKKVPLYFRGDSTLLSEPGGIKKHLKTVFLKWVYHHVTHAFYVGQNNKNYFLKYGLKEEQLSFAPHAVDNSRFKIMRQKEAQELRLSLAIGNEDILVVFAGKLEPVKNLSLLLDAFTSVNKPNVHLLLVGNGINEAELKKKAIDSLRANNIHFLDFQNQTMMPVIYQAADLYCLPSKSETWGLSINEAMGCDKAILASNTVGCAADLIKTRQNGEIFESGNLKSLRDSLISLTSSKQRLAEMGEQSGKIIADWNFLKIAEAIENKLLNNVIINN